MKLVGAFEIDALDRAKWKKQMGCKAPSIWERKTLKRRELSMSVAGGHARLIIAN